MKRLLFSLVFFLWASPYAFAQLTQTPNLGLYLIPFGYPQWNVPVNDNSVLLDTKVLTLNMSCEDGQVPGWSGGKFSICVTPTGGPGGTGDITDVIAGPGLTGGGTTGSVTIAVGVVSPLVSGPGAISCPTCAILPINLASSVNGILPNVNTTAASTNTPSAIVARDSSGNFAAGTITANTLIGNATTATTAATATTAGALAANPAPCTVGQFVTDIAADGTLTCATPAGGGGTGDIEGVTAGAGLIGGGTTATVTLDIGVTLPLTVTADAVACPTCGVTGQPLSQFANTTSANLAAIITNETGTNALVFSNNPVLVTPDIQGGGTASATTFWRGDKTWAVPVGGGNVSTTSTNVYGAFLQDFGTASLEIPNSAAATPAAVGQITLDTTLGDTKIHNGAEVKTFVYSSDINLDGFGTVSARNPANYTAISIATRNQIGVDANNHVGITHDPTEGPIVDCWIGGIRGNCDRTAKLNADKNFAIKDRNGANLVLTKETLGGAYSEMREGTGDPASPVTGYWRIYPKSGGIYAQSPAGVVSGPLGAGGAITQIIQFCATDTAVNDTDYLSLNDCLAEPGGSGNVDGKWMAGYNGTVREIGCNLAAAPASTNTVIITTTKQATGSVPSGATSTTTMTFTLTGATREGSATTNQVAFVKGDFLGLQKVDSISATASAATKCYMKVEAS